MRSDVVESHPPQNAENRGSNISYRPGYRVPELDPHRYRTQSSGHKSQGNQFRLTPGEGWLALVLLGIAVYSVVFSIVFGNLAGLSSEGLPYPLFSLAALVPWTFFSTALLLGSDSLVANSALARLTGRPSSASRPPRPGSSGSRSPPASPPRSGSTSGSSSH